MVKRSANKRQYVKISQIQKQALLQLVFQIGMKIREASLKLNIKYAASKTMVLQFKKKLIKKEFQYASSKPCQIGQKTKDKATLKIITQVGGKEINSKTYRYN
ncbi:unnamed protein product (macronuclear) [Paramecium tetraurelia]|uniref:HTH psq-type domain-containing protein n=1 Tax=Paramecium tetraurelia TaxID=5888 RepID=A0CUB7_PARTE|nr:uncharacterized protein GSPATT00010584001 [Paramecium tetraurelia]CAK74384.1 unnamed protein product [Paramecium tetraurelia]|eukprot:XP_001441781.1 hypothetical protein (macronuclear) [Paramecium tetraurelia strain d4-2]